MASSKAGQQDAADQLVTTSVRVPGWLYEQVLSVLLSQPERPSYGQLVMWAIEDHPNEVADEIASTAPPSGVRVPRGRRVATARASLGLRLTVSERAVLDDLADIANEYNVCVTRTDVAVAALTVAVRHGPAVDVEILPYSARTSEHAAYWHRVHPEQAPPPAQATPALPPHPAAPEPVAAPSPYIAEDG